MKEPRFRSFRTKMLNQDCFPQHSFALGPTVWRDYAVITTCEIEIASGQDAVTAMSPDELLVAIEDYAIEDYSSDPDRYNDIIIRLVSGHMHRLVEEVMLEWMDVL